MNESVVEVFFDCAVLVFTFQSTHQVRVSLWLQWTLPRFVVNLYGKQSGGSQPSAAPVCVSAELEDLTASIDYKDMQLQIQYKLGAFNITHSFKRYTVTWPSFCFIQQSFLNFFRL